MSRTKSLLVFTSLGLLGMVLTAATRGPTGPTGPTAGGDATAPPATAKPGPGQLVVHEWGTFTGFAGSDGVHLPFLTTIGLELPEFVSNRQREAIRRDHQTWAGLLFLKGGGEAALQRMETPVDYFYTDRPREVDVRVDFPPGLLTEFYPPVRAMGPEYGKGLGEPRRPDATPATRPSESAPAAAAARSEPSFLDWGRVRIVPTPGAEEAKLVPPVKNGGAAGAAYGFARETDSALVEFTDTDNTRHAEKFLFYRGLGNFTLPVTLTAQGGGRFVLNNAGPSSVPVAFLIHIDGRPGVPARFARFDDVKGRREMTLPAGDAAADAAAGALGEEIVRALIAQGLYEKEARAMLATWKASWLGEPGTRVLYIVPRPVTDELLPLHISPAPDAVTRVLVGRIDVLTPEQESRLASMLSAVAAASPDDSGDFQALSNEDVRIASGLGRFLGPALDRVVKLHGDVASPEQARRLQRAINSRQAKAAAAK